MQISNFQTICGTLFLQSILFACKFHSSQAMRNLISSIINVVYELSRESPNDLIKTWDHRKLGNENKISKLSGGTGPVSPSKISFWQ